MTMTHLSSEPLDPAAVTAAIAGPAHGAVTSFTGVVRDHHRGRTVLGLEYTAYQPMAESACGEIVAEAEARWPARVRIVHRLGELAVGEAAVVIAAASAHRDDAFAACRYAIEELKRRVPIWKRERYADGTEAWVDPTAEGATRREERGGIPA